MNHHLNTYFKIICVSAIIFPSGCKEPANEDLTLEVKNDLNFPRKEVVAINRNVISKFLEGKSENDLHLKKEGDKNYLRTQWIDYDQDGTSEELLFQADVPPNASANYVLVVDSTKTEPKSDIVAYSRFVPERTDDYTWENDKVAFRTYGPTGQKEALEGVPGSTMSSGIDLWLKSTERSIINKWYAEHVKSPGYYHINHGEGYDPYHVGGSRGTGGIGVWENDSLYVSRNYTDYKTIADGPLRTVFDLTYAPWSPYNIQETKRITLDLGSNFSKFEISLSAADSIPNYTIGITLHENKGKAKVNEEKGWFRHWEIIDNSYVGEGIVINPSVVDSAFAHKSEVPDQSNLLIVANPQDKLSYYAGFAWDESGQVKTVEDWDTILEQQAQILENPLTISLK